MNQLKHVPIRTCIVTKEKLPKSELLRIVKTSEGGVEVDPHGKISGRGANIKMEVEMLDKAFKIGAIERALKLGRKLTIEEQLKLKTDFIACIEENNFRKGQKHVKIRVKKEELEKITSD